MPLLHLCTISQRRWNDLADKAFQHLKSLFVLVPIFIVPDPTREFPVEVDTRAL